MDFHEWPSVTYNSDELQKLGIGLHNVHQYSQSVNAYEIIYTHIDPVYVRLAPKLDVDRCFLC